MSSSEHMANDLNVMLLDTTKLWWKKHGKVSYARLTSFQCADHIMPHLCHDTAKFQFRIANA
jgi:hypothetical protein